MNPDIIMHLNWAINTIRDKVMFGRDELGASLAREARAKGVMIDAIKYIEELHEVIESYRKRDEEYLQRLSEEGQYD
ncbi:hypothetical protein EBQ81_01460 [bacterium]|nr:hypothetical protein [bacterium]